MRPPLFVDGNSIAHRALHAGGDLTTSEGVPTGLIFLFLQMLKAAVQAARPSFIQVAWDSPRATLWRREVYSEYKNNRVSTPESDARYQSFVAQADVLKGMLTALGVGQLRIDGYEADDIVAWWAKRFGRGVVFSSDRDLWQLITEQVWVLSPDDRHADGFIRLSNFLEVSGLPTPADWLEFRCLSGDDGDHVSGIGRVGKVRGRELATNGGFLSTYTLEKYGQEWVEQRRELYVRNRTLMDLQEGCRRLNVKHGARDSTGVEFLPPRFQPDAALKIAEQCELNSIVTAWPLWVELFNDTR